MALIEIKGLDRLNAQLDAIPRNVRQKIARRALYRAAALVRDEARQLAPRKTGLLKRSIVIRSSRGSGGRGSVAYKVGLLQRAWYGRLVEFGHVRRGPGGKLKGGERRRIIQRDVLNAIGQFVPPQPFMRPAADKLPQALAVFEVVVREGIGSGELFT